MKRKLNTKVLYVKEWRKVRTGEKGKTTVEWWYDARRGKTIIRVDLTEDDIDSKQLIFYLPYKGMKVWLTSLAEEHTPKEVFEELDLFEVFEEEFMAKLAEIGGEKDGI